MAPRENAVWGSSRGWLLALAVALVDVAACADLFHSTAWEPGAVASGGEAGASTVSGSGGAGGAGGGGSVSQSSAASGIGGAGLGGAGGACAHCMDGFEQGLQASFCSGSEVLFIQLGQCICTNCADVCIEACQLSDPDAGMPSDACIACATAARAGPCQTQYDACVADGP